MVQQPKPFINKINLRRKAYGTERRRNMSRLILDKGTPLPKPIEYSDIDVAMFNWIEEHIDIEYDGKKIPTYKFYSTQRLTEYMQSWDKIDDNGNLIMNFKIITRENNPQKGESQGGYFNIPGHKDFAMFYVPRLLENGTEALDVYTMKQPTQVNFTYSVSIVTNKMEILNEMNEQMHYEFNAMNAYISPNDHPMSMTLEDISDDSEYSLDDRKYYSQTYKIKVRGYIIREQDFKVETIPARIVMGWRDVDSVGKATRRKKNRRKEELVEGLEVDKNKLRKFNLDVLRNNSDEFCQKPPIRDDQWKDDIEPDENNTDCCIPKPDRYQHKVVRINIKFDCTSEVEFYYDKNFVLESIETKNVFDLQILVNSVKVDYGNGLEIKDGDMITIKISKDDIENNISEIVLIGYDPDVVLDTELKSELIIDEPITEELVYIGYEEDET